MPDGSIREYPAGTKMEITLKELLDVAHLSLDDTNEAAAESEAGGQGKPTYRNTGAEIEVLMHYNNDPVGSVTINQNVDVQLEVIHKPKTWVSVGPRTYYIRYPRGASGSQYSHKVITYPQDVTLFFKPTGQAWRFDFFAMVQSFIDAIVLMVRRAQSSAATKRTCTCPVPVLARARVSTLA